MNENLNATNNQTDKNKSTLKQKKTKCSQKNCTNFKYALLVVAVSMILIATTIFSNTYFDYKEKNQQPQENTLAVQIDHYNARKHINESSPDDINYFSNSLFDQLNTSMIKSHFALQDIFANQNMLNQRSHITASENNYIITFEVPGFIKEQIKIELISNILIVKADNNNQDNRKQLQYKIVLQHDVITESITSFLENGILTINVPRIKSIPQTIAID